METSSKWHLFLKWFIFFLAVICTVLSLYVLIDAYVYDLGGSDKTIILGFFTVPFSILLWGNYFLLRAGKYIGKIFGVFFLVLFIIYISLVMYLNFIEDILFS